VRNDENTHCRVIYSSVARGLSLMLHVYIYYNMNIFLKTCHIKLSVPGGPARQKDRVKSCAVEAPVRLRAVATCGRAIFFARKWLIIIQIKRYNNIILLSAYNILTYVYRLLAVRPSLRARVLHYDRGAFAQSGALPTVETREMRAPARVLLQR